MDGVAINGRHLGSGIFFIFILVLGLWLNSDLMYRWLLEIRRLCPIDFQSTFRTSFQQQSAELTLVDTIRKVNHNNFLDKTTDLSYEGLVGWVSLDVVVTIFCRLKGCNESMGYPILRSVSTRLRQQWS